MNLVEYQELSKRTMPYNGEPANQVEFEHMLGNYAMGLVGEFLELIQISGNLEEFEGNLLPDESLKEMGDVLHYAVGLLSCLGLTVDERKVQPSRKGAIHEAGDILEMVKKHIYHRHELKEQELIVRVYKVIYGIEYLASDSFSMVMQTNIDKLKTRYPDEFSTADSIARVDTVEGK